MNFDLPAGLIYAAGLGLLGLLLVVVIPLTAVSIARSLRGWLKNRERRARRRAFHRQMKRKLATTARGTLLTRHPSDVH